MNTTNDKSRSAPAQTENSAESSTPGNSRAEELLLASARVQIAGYRLVCSLGGGGQGCVYKALRHSDGRAVAIKLLHSGVFADVESRARFDREVAALKLVRHPGVVEILDDGETTDGHRFLVTEFVDGQPLDHFVASTLASEDIAARLRLFVRICDAVDAAHDCALVHRDLSSSNVLVDAQGRPHVIDFGIARAVIDPLIGSSASVTASGVFIGKLDYAAPEQIRGAPPTPAADVYALGVILYGLLCNGRLPHNHGGGTIALAQRILTEPPTPMCISKSTSVVNHGALELITMTALSKLPADRPQSAGELGRAVLAQLPVHAPPSTAGDNQAAGAFESPSLSPSIGGTVSITGYQQRSALIDWANEIRAIIASRGDHAGAAQIDAAIEGYRADRFTLAVIGKAKRGKSTLLNALLGRKDDLVAPVDKLPASSAITRFGFAPSEAAEVYFRDERRLPIPFASIREYVTEEANPENAKGVAIVRVSGPFAGIDQDLELVDTPGAGSIHEHHDALLHAFIPEADAVIFLVSARMPLDDSELDLLKKIKAADVKKLFFAINRIDESTTEDIEAAIRHNVRLLTQAGIDHAHFHRISAKRAFKGDSAGSGLATLTDDLRKHLAQHKGRVLANRFIQQVLVTAEPAKAGFDAALTSAERTAEQLAADLSGLKARRSTIADDRKYAEKTFLNSWERAMHEFVSALPEARDATVRFASEQITDCPLLQLGSFTKSLPSAISAEVERQTSPLASRFESSVADTCGRFAETYPTVQLGAPAAMIRSQGTGGMAMPAVGGMAAVATGLSLVGAGASAVVAPTVVTVAAPVAGVLGTVGGWLGGLFGASAAGSSLGAGLATGTATIAGTTPLWVAMSGPIGWTLAGVGAVAIPLAWRSSKIRQKDKLIDVTEKEIVRLFRRLETERVPALRRMGDSIVKDLALKLDREFDQVEAAIAEALNARPTDAQMRLLRDTSVQFARLAQSPPLMPNASEAGVA